MDPQQDFSPSDLAMRRKIQWLLVFRLLVAIFFLSLTLIVQTRRSENLLAAHLQPLYFFSVILFGFTIFAALDLKRVRNLKRFAYAQLAFDVEAVTVLVFMSGGVESLFSFLYTPVIISAAIILFRRGSLLIASLASLSYGLLLDLQYFGWISPLQIVSSQSFFTDSGTYFHTLLMNLAAFFMVAYLSGYMAEEAQKSGQRLMEKQRDLEYLERLHRKIVQNMTSGLLTLDENGKILYSNQAAQETLKRSPGEINARPIGEVVPELEAALQRDEDVPLQERDIITYHCPSRASDGSDEGAEEKLHLGYTVSSFHEEGWSGPGRIILFRDLTELKRMERHMERMRRLAFAGKMAAEIAHEIKNPLGAMSGAIQMLCSQGQGTDPVRERLMGIVTREIHRINELVTNFLWLARGARKSENKESVSVCAVVEDILELLKNQNGMDAGHHIKVHYQLDPLLFIDPNYFRQILWNLLTNAVEVIPDGGDIQVRVAPADGAPSAELHERREPHSSKGVGANEFFISVEDSGPGIAEELQDRVFEPFFTTKDKGTGLGLSIVYQLVENADGRIAIGPSSLGGTAFWIFFPFFSFTPLAKLPGSTYSSTRSE